MPFITKDIFVNEKCIMYKDSCTTSGDIDIKHEYDAYGDEIGAIRIGNTAYPILIGYKKYADKFSSIDELYREILFHRLGVPKH